MKKVFFIILLWGFYLINVHAATTGKIGGKVVDKDSGDPLPGVNISIDGSAMGAATDTRGNYFILNVPPGNYTVVASMMGYDKVKTTNVQVYIDRTTNVNFGLKMTTLQGQEVTVVAEREKIQADVSYSQLSITSDEIETAPTGVDLREAISMGVGIERDLYGHISIRGGEIDEIGYFVDDLSRNDRRIGIPVIKVPQSAVKEIQVLTGGFNAEYGEARSGMINVVTKEGGSDYTFSVDYRMSPAARKHFGPDLFSPENWWDVGRYLYMEPSPDRDGDGVPDFEGWISYMERNNGQKSIPGPYGTAGVAKSAEEMFEIWKYQHRPQEYANEADNYVEGTFGGPVPFTNNKLNFFYSGYFDRTLFAFRFAIPAYVDQAHTLKLNYQLTDNIKLRYTGNYGETRSVTYNAEPGTFVDVHHWGNVMDAMDGVAAGHLYNSDTRLVNADVWRSLQGLELSHVLNEKSFYEVKLQYDRTKYRAHPGEMRDTTVVKVIGDVRLDETPYNFAPNKYKDVLNIHRLGEDKGWRDYTWYETVQMRADYTNQITNRHQIKTGIKGTLNKMYLDYGRHRWSDSHINEPHEYWTSRDISYLELGGYVQDKIEFEGMIMNIGLRFDSFRSNEQAFTDPWSYFYSKGVNYDSLYFADAEIPDMKFVLSPRLGVSHPITENAKLFFNYGYFYQRATIDNLYGDIRKLTSSLDQMGNPSLDFRKTISYELGVEQNLFDLFTYKLTGYYKDVSNEIGTVTFSGNTYSYSYDRDMNNRYKDIRGFEVELYLPYSKHFSGRVSYDYRLLNYGWYGFRTYYEDPFKRNVIQSPNQSKPRPRPKFRANLTFKNPPASSESIMNKILSDIIISTYFQWEAGAWLTYHSESYPGTEENNIQWTPWYNLDVNISKGFKLFGVQTEIYTEIFNVLNSKFLNANGSFWNQSITSQEQYLELVAEKGLDPGEYKDPDVQKFLEKSMYYLLYGPKRDIWFGIRMNL